jgi:hypothetical protein
MLEDSLCCDRYLGEQPRAKRGPRLKSRASGLTPQAVLEKFAAVQMLDIHLPTTDGREIVLTRYTQPEKDLLLLLQQLGLTLPEQAPPKIHSPQTISNQARL